MAIYEARGFQQNSLHLFDKKTPFDYIVQFKPQVVPDNISLEDYKRTQAPYCLSGKVNKEKDGSYKRNNSTLVYRDLIFLDYDDIKSTAESFKETVSRALHEYAYILYPTIKHTVEKPRYRLVVKPNNVMNEVSYKQVVKEIAERIGLPFDLSSLTWSQLQGLPVTRGRLEEYDKVINYGLDFPIIVNQSKDEPKKKTECTTQHSQSITMRIIDTLLHGFGDKGGRNVAVTRFVGLLFNKWVDCDLETAYELTQIANSVTTTPLPIDELDRTFTSIARAEFRKRGRGYQN